MSVAQATLGQEFIDRIKSLLVEIVSSVKSTLESMSDEERHQAMTILLDSFTKTMAENETKRHQFYQLMRAYGADLFGPVSLLYAPDVKLDMIHWSMVSSQFDDPHNVETTGYSLRDSVVWIRLKQGGVFNINFTVNPELTVKLIENYIRTIAD